MPNVDIPNLSTYFNEEKFHFLSVILERFEKHPRVSHLNDKNFESIFSFKIIRYFLILLSNEKNSNPVVSICILTIINMFMNYRIDVYCIIYLTNCYSLVFWSSRPFSFNILVTRPGHFDPIVSLSWQQNTWSSKLIN